MRKTEKSSLNRLIRSAFIAALAGAAMVLPGIDTARAAPPGSCPSVITSCGCVITASDTYLVGNDLSAAQTSKPNCIEIAASNSILNVDGFKVLGKDNGTGIGILIRKGADNVIVEGGKEINNIPPENPTADDPPATSAQAKVNLWRIGIEDDGDNAIIALFSDFGGSLLQNSPNFVPKGNSFAGVFVNGVKDSFIGIFNASYNGKYGVLMRNSSGVTLANFTAAFNMETGLKLESSNGTSIGPAGGSSNGKYGMWLASSSRNTIHDSNGNSFNGDTGILLSCASGPACPGHDGSNENRITNAGAPRNKMRGIVIGNGNENNTVTVTHNEDNGNPQSDMIDLNLQCDNNIWYTDANNEQVRTAPHVTESLRSGVDHCADSHIWNCSGGAAGRMRCYNHCLWMRHNAGEDLHGRQQS
jgi:hypothetical protein